jgi:hypothetical protein
MTYITLDITYKIGGILGENLTWLQLKEFKIN